MKNKIIQQKDLSSLKKKNKEKKIGLAHGVFDLFHYGHLLHLKKAKSLCDVLFVSITKDEYINKAPGRPIYNKNQRLKLISSLDFVDFVLLSNNKTANKILSNLKPDIYFKGSDYLIEKNDYSGGISSEKKTVEKFGGKLVFTDEKTLSSTKLINRFSNELDEKTKKYLSKLKNNLNFNKLKSLLDKSSDTKTLVIGDMIIDEYVFSSPLGKSPKEQLISMQELKREVYGGGIVASVNHLSSFLKNCSLLSVVSDNLKKNNVSKFINKNIKKILFKEKDHKTIIKTRYLDQLNNKLFQISNVRRNNIKSLTEKRIIKFLNKNLKNYDHVIVHDFGHGVVTKKIISLLEKKSKYLSINVQTNSSNIGFNYITKFVRTNYFSIDEPEARLALSDENSNTIQLFNKLKKEIKFQSASITFGKHGSYSYSNKKIFFSPALIKSPVDTLGAGDAYFVISAMISIFTKKPEEIGFLGNAAGALVVNYLGHQKYITKEYLLNYLKTYLNI